MIAIGKTFFRQSSYPEALIIGFCLLLAPLALIHLFAPINQVIAVLLAVFGLVWLARNRPPLKLTKSTLWFSVVVLALAVLAARHALGGDDGLYHIQAAKWYSTYAVVPGLANLHSRFGFNSSYYLYAALFSWLPGGAAHYVAGPLWIGVLGLSLNSRFGKLFVVSLAIWAVYVSTLSNDFPIFLLTLVMGFALFQSVQHRKQNISYLILLAFLGSTIKLSFVFFAFPAVGLILYLDKPSLKNIIAPSLLGVLFGLIWMIHGIYLSGYPLYPFTVAQLNVDWRLPESVAVLEQAWVTAWAKAPGTVTTQIDWNWLPEWWRYSSFNLNASIPLIFGLFALPFCVIRRPRILFFVPLAIGLAFWFLTAPDIRFAAGMLWLLVAALLYSAIPEKWDRFFLTSFLIVGVILCLFNLIPTTVEESQFYTYQVNDQTVYLPVHDAQCFDHDLPCAAYKQYVEQLQMRQAGNLAQGFKSKSN